MNVHYVTLKDREEEGVFLFAGDHTEERIDALAGPLPKEVAYETEPSQHIELLSTSLVSPTPGYWEARPDVWWNRRAEEQNALYEATRQEEREKEENERKTAADLRKQSEAVGRAWRRVERAKADALASTDDIVASRDSLDTALDEWNKAVARLEALGVEVPEKERPPAIEKPVNELWEEYLVEGYCGLCGNYGEFGPIVSYTAAGKKLELGVVFCVCPNGRAMKKARESGGL
jgi:hypothetical protein